MQRNQAPHRRADRRRPARRPLLLGVVLAVASLFGTQAATAEESTRPAGEPAADQVGTDQTERSIGGEPFSLSAAGSVVPGRYIVRVQDDAALADLVAALEASGIEPAQVWDGAIVGLAVDLGAAELVDVRAHPGVVAVEADSIVELDVDHGLRPQTGASMLQAPQVDPPWGLDRIDQRARPLNSTYRAGGNGGAGVTVYVIDSGIRFDHTEFTGRIGAGIWFSIGSNTDAWDCNGHGTHVAGTIGGTTYGVAKQVTIVPIKAFDCGGSTTESVLVDSLDWVMQQHQPGDRSVLNMSLGGPPSGAIDAAVRAVIADGVTVVAAAGNDTIPSCNVSPARVSEAITVSASDITDGTAGFANYGACNDLFAPGVGILSAGIASNTAAALSDGTSMAAPHVAGAAALVLAANPSATPAQVWNTIDAATTRGALTECCGDPDKLLFVSPPGIFFPGTALAVADRLRP